jgi:hypothetical protein
VSLYNLPLSLIIICLWSSCLLIKLAQLNH